MQGGDGGPPGPGAPPEPESARPSTARPTAPRRRRRSGLFVVLVLLVAAVALVGLFLPFLLSPGLPPEAVLVLDLRSELPERRDLDALEALLGGGGGDLVAVHAAIARASRDPAVSGLVLRVGRPGMGPGRIEELRGLIARFRGAGKPVVAVLEGADSLGYWLATAADEVWMGRTADLDLIGLEMQAFFLGDALATLGLEADMVRVGEYKGTYEQLVGSESSPEFREAMESSLGSVFDRLVAAIAEARGLTADAVRALIDDGPFSGERALGEGLVDRLVYRDEVAALLAGGEREGNGDDRPPIRMAGEEVGLGVYLDAAAGAPEPAVALVHVTGLLVDGAGGLSPFGDLAGADVAREALRTAREDPATAAVVLRVDSAGGALSASEAVWREVALTAEQKPVVVSMGDTAASGGYYIATGATRIVAHGATLTGSIGIFGGKIVAGELLDELGVGVETARRGARAGLYDLHRRFDAGERAAMERLVREGYDLFIRRVAEGRAWTAERVEESARGRVWTGAEALSRGLVDRLGGLAEAIEEAQALAGLSRDGLVEPTLFPPERGLLELLIGGAERQRYLGVRGEGTGASAIALDALRRLEQIGLLDGRHRMALAPWRFRIR